MLTAFIITVCTYTADPKSCKTKEYQYARSNTCEWGRVQEANKAYKRGAEVIIVKDCEGMSTNSKGV